MGTNWAAATGFTRPPLPAFRNCHTQPLQTGWPTVVAYSFDSDEDYDKWKGNDWTPWNKAWIDPGLVGMTGPLDTFRKLDTNLTHEECTWPSETGSWWHAQRVGPFSSKGNNSWLQMSGRDALHLSTPLETYGQIFVTQSFGGPVDSNGQFIPLPTLHIHHVHLLYSLLTPGREIPVAPSVVYAYGASGSNYVIEHHSESSYDDLDGTVHSEGDPEGYGRLIMRPFDVTLEFNDYRPPLSPPVSYYVQLAVMWWPQDADITPVSYGVAGLPGIAGPFYPGRPLGGDYMWFDRPCVMWLSSPIPESGQILTIKHHNHMSFTVKAFLLKLYEDELVGLGLVPSARNAAISGNFYPPVPEAEPLWQAGLVGMPREYSDYMFQRTMPFNDTRFATFEQLELEIWRIAGPRVRCVVTPQPKTVGSVSNVDTFGMQTCYDLPWKVIAGEMYTHILLAQPAKPGVPFAIHSAWHYHLLSPEPQTCVEVRDAKTGVICSKRDASKAYRHTVRLPEPARVDPTAPVLPTAPMLVVAAGLAMIALYAFRPRMCSGTPTSCVQADPPRLL
uniref:Uncharacterized protein n=1 Tax=Haptolina brevifila TaxID=156173 RepID=A0A7S2DNJ1_9EUKA|mmetsp:Transcript_41577/g.83351  ORF Transcript_41577/g.83351 Transcript_41577/m.83351 type:complete len:559 (+) Transcript_41577:25-1701(+)